MLGFFADIKILYRTMVAHHACPDFAARALISNGLGFAAARRGGRSDSGGHGRMEKENFNF